MNTQPATSKIAQLTPAKLQRWSRNNRALVATMLRARAVAASERARVDAYITPLFATFDFRDESGKPIASADRLYRCKDRDACARFYTACDVAHREHGFVGEAGYCPALVADHAAVEAESAVVRSMEALLGVEVLHLDHRAKLLKLVVDMVAV